GGGGGTRAGDRPVGGAAVLGHGGLGRHQGHARPEHVRTHAPVERQALRRERRHLAGRAVPDGRGGAERQRRLLATREGLQRRPRDVGGDGDDRDGDALVEAEPAGGDLRAVEDDGGGPGPGRVLNRADRVVGGGNERRAAG